MLRFFRNIHDGQIFQDFIRSHAFNSKHGNFSIPHKNQRKIGGEGGSVNVCASQQRVGQIVRIHMGQNQITRSRKELNFQNVQSFLLNEVSHQQNAVRLDGEAMLPHISSAESLNAVIGHQVGISICVNRCFDGIFFGDDFLYRLIFRE